LYNEFGMSEFDKTPLYLQIAESVRQEIVYGTLRPGESLPTVREMAARWRCTVGTVQRAYAELARQGLVTSRTGQGTRVATVPSLTADRAPLRRATLANHVERFLLETMAIGYEVGEIEQALRLALDHWHALAAAPAPAPDRSLRFVGSHDPAVSLVAANFEAIAAGHTLSVAFGGSLGGLIALTQGEADLAGCHLWDEATDAYNVAFVQRLLPGRQAALLTLAHRRLGLLLAAGNPTGLHSLQDLARPGVRFVNRQRGAGTRVWLDAQLHRQGVDPGQLAGYGDEALTHSDVARAVADGRADAGLGIEAAALSYGLAFVPLTTERYDLAMLTTVWRSEPIQRLAVWLRTPDARQAITALGGYVADATGEVTWVG
jgi:molybdate-binding protein/DNA-binding transcriptional regulator YhcF (GntR family)